MFWKLHFLEQFFELQLSFKIFLLQLYGIHTHGENIADNGGIKEACRAYRKWTEEHDPELKLPGQMFWIAASQISCAKYRKVIIYMCVYSSLFKCFFKKWLKLPYF